MTRILKDIYQFVIERKDDSNFSAIDICEYAVRLLEDDPLYNAGHGAVFSRDQTHVLEASIMDGRTRQSGAASLLRHIKNPVTAARAVLERSVHGYLLGESAEKLAVEQGADSVNNSYFSTPHRLDHWTKHSHDVLTGAAAEEAKKGTVGCVCMFKGHVAASTSTGGMTGKDPNRVGDSPLVGCGNYADDSTAAVSCTGTGEEIMRHVAAYDVTARMKYKGLSLANAVTETIVEYLPVNTTGVIAVDRQGAVALRWNTKGMLRGVLRSDRTGWVGVFEKDIAIDV